MDKEKEIEEMARVMCPTAEYISCDKCVAKKCTPQMYAAILCGADYGNVKQAVKEFAEETKQKVYPYEEVDGEDVCEDIDELFYKTLDEWDNQRREVWLLQNLEQR